MSELPYHPEYGLPDDFRQRVLNYIKDMGCTQSEAARTFNLHPSTVNLWVRGITRKQQDLRHG